MFNLDWMEMIHNLGRLAIAYLLAVPIGWDRESSTRSAGLRTFPLVAVAACGYALVGVSVLSSTEAEARIIAGIITGIGFIGGGAILKDKGSVHGTATATSIWITGLIGIATAFERYEVAVLMSAIAFVTLRYVRRIKQ